MKQFIKSLLAVVFVLGGLVSFGGQAFAIGAPNIISADAINITSSGAMLTGSVNPNGATTSAWFEIQNGAQSSHQNIGGGNSPVNLNTFSANNLNANSNFKFRIVASNAIGNTYSSWVSFTTLPANDPQCQAGMIGTPPNCTWPQPDTCAPGQIGIPPNCTWPPIPDAPMVNLTANPANIQAGQSSTLSWSVSNATSCFASGGWSGSKNKAGGSQVVTPSQTTTYTITCTGLGGSSSDSATVTVTQPQNPPTVTLTANPNSVSYNGSTILSWNVQNATSCVANSNPATTWTGNKNSNGGTQVVSDLTNTTFFNIFCTGPGGSDSATATVTVGAQPVNLPTVTLTANPTSVTSGGSTVLSWNSNNATSCSANSSNSQWTGAKSTSGSMTVTNLNSTTTFTITCNNSAGSVSDSTSVSVINTPVVQLPYVTTYSATNIGPNYATLNGYVDPNGSAGTRWFEWSTTNGFLSNSTNRVYQGAFPGNISDSLLNLPPSTIIYFRAAAQNSQGTAYGNVLSFVTTGNIITNPCAVFGSCLPTAVTTFATNIGTGSARLNGLGLQNVSNTSLNGFFEWGTTQALGNTTITNFIGNGSSNPYFANLFVLQSNTTYYYRAVVTNQNGSISRGSIVPFRTGTVLGVATTANPSLAYRNTTLVTNTNIVGTGVSKPSLVFLDTTCNKKILAPGDILECTVHWKNVSQRNLTGVLLRTGFPQELEFQRSSIGNFSPVDNAVVVEIGNLAPQQEGSMTFTTRVRTDAELGKIIVIASNLVYSYIGDNNAFNQEEVFSYSDHTISGNNAGIVAGAAIFSGGFMPNSLAGWLLLLLLVLLILLAVKMVYNNARPQIVNVPPANGGMH